MKYYKVIKENFLWEAGAILVDGYDNGKGYQVIDDIFKKHEAGEYISTEIIENSPEYFERVYKIDLVTRVLYEVKDKAMELMKGQFKA